MFFFWPPRWCGRLRRGVEAATAEDEAARAAYDLAKITVAAETARAYADVCNAGEQLAVTQHSLQLQVKSTDVTERLFQAGRVPRLDLTRSAGQVGGLLPCGAAVERSPEGGVDREI